MKRRVFLKKVCNGAGVTALGGPRVFGADEPAERIRELPGDYSAAQESGFQ
jgi:hypothetical protein